jgi:hypothetical protein
LPSIVKSFTARNSRLPSLITMGRPNMSAPAVRDPTTEPRRTFLK